MSPEPFDTLYTLAAFERVQELDISGTMRMLPTQIVQGQTLADVLQTIEYDHVPCITLPGLKRSPNIVRTPTHRVEFDEQQSR